MLTYQWKLEFMLNQPFYYEEILWTKKITILAAPAVKANTDQLRNLATQKLGFNCSHEII